MFAKSIVIFKLFFVVWRRVQVFDFISHFVRFLEFSGYIIFSYVYRGYYMAARRYEISRRVLKNISLVRCAHS